MADNQFSSFPIVELLKALGARPGNRKNTYHSPFREDKDASLHIDPLRNLWFDHGAGVGGGNIDLVIQCRRCTRREAAEYILGLPQCAPGGAGDASPGNGPDKSGGNSPRTNRILMIRDLRSPYLLEYTAARGIPDPIAVRYCKEVILRGKTIGKTYDNIGFPNNAGGFALKSPSGFKSTTKSGITTIDTTGIFSLRPTSGIVTIFEGFFDFLSWLAMNKREIPDTDICVLNSVANLGRAFPYLKAHSIVRCCLDNDKAGLKAMDDLREQLQGIASVEKSSFYEGFKDVNEWWIASCKHR